MIIRIKCRFCDEMVQNNTNHFCEVKRSFIPCNTKDDDFNLVFYSSNSVGGLYYK